MNITKTLCLCAALSGAAGIQAMENCELVTKQDNTRVNTYQTNRPEVSKRLFVSQEVEQQIARIKQLLTNAKLAWMFENCFPNTLDTTVHFDGKEAGRSHQPPIQMYQYRPIRQRLQYELRRRRMDE